jgi:hypothetical protein
VEDAELVVDDDLAVVRLVPEWSNTNYIIYRSIIIIIIIIIIYILQLGLHPVAVVLP